MKRLARKFVCVTLFVLTIVLAAAPIYGGIVRDIGLGLGQFGFDFLANRNLLSGGIDFLATNRFVGNELDFGPGDFSLVGPLSQSVSTGGRHLSELEVSLRTSEGPTQQAEPLRYFLNVDVGGQATQVEGSIFLDANIVLNGFGFYDLNVEYSSRQTVDQDGRFADGTQNHDFDLGPIRVSGNIIADILAVATDPFFERSGLVNIFASFSGREQLLRAIEEQTQAEAESLASAIPNNLGGVESEANGRILDQLVRRSSTSLTQVATYTTPHPAQEVGVIPEPVVLVLLLLGLPLVLSRRAR